MFAGARQHGEDTTLIRFRPEARERADFRELVEILQLDPDRLVYSIEPTIDRMDGRTFNIRTRSFQGIMYFCLSRSRRRSPTWRPAGSPGPSMRTARRSTGCR